MIELGVKQKLYIDHKTDLATEKYSKNRNYKK